ncbi:MAG: oligosaccharide flippase family protein [Candidatus Marinimicrobia bacterium]|nr:oligosaccharide flippase family protein [Candidatus Neomarinimicrobiota bacterium]
MKQFGNESLVYGIGYVSIRAVSFLLLPLFTNILTKEEFGIYVLIFTFIAFTQVFYSYGLDSALMKYYVKAAEDEQTI